MLTYLAVPFGTTEANPTVRPPVQPVSLASPSQALHPRAHDLRSETADDSVVRRYRMVREVPTDDRAEPTTLLINWVMSVPHHGALKRLERGPPPLRDRVPAQQEASPAGLPTNVNQPEEMKGLRRTSLTRNCLPSSSSCSKPTTIQPLLDESQQSMVPRMRAVERGVGQLLREAALCARSSLPRPYLSSRSLPELVNGYR